MKSVLEDIAAVAQMHKHRAGEELPRYMPKKDMTIWLRIWVEQFIGAFQASVVHKATDSDIIRIRLLLEGALERRNSDDSRFPEFVSDMLSLVHISLELLVQCGVPVEEVWGVHVMDAKTTGRPGGTTENGRILRPPVSPLGPIKAHLSALHQEHSERMQKAKEDAAKKRDEEIEKGKRSDYGV